MFIYHFNRLIRNRLVWLAFALIISFAFLSVDSCVRNPGDSRDGRGAGRLGDKAMDQESYAYAELFVRGGRNQPAADDPAMADTQVWQHLAALQSARDLGLVSSDDEIRRTIREQPGFSNGGHFDARLYRATIARNLGVTPGIYERLMGDQISLSKMAATIAAANWISPMEVADELAALTDQLTVQYAVVSNRFADSSFEITDSELRAFHDEHAAAFALPDRVGVHYAAAPVSNFIARVTVPDEDIAEFYDSNANRYTHTTTNDTLETQTLAEVRDEIAAELALDEARFAAVTNAALFVEQLGLADLAEFTWRARARRLAVQPSPLFSMEEEVAGIEPEAQSEFRENAFDLDFARADARFAVVRGKDFVYILQAWTNSPAHTPSFEQVVEQVRPMALAQARAKAFEALAREIREGIAAGMAGGTNFAAAARQARADNVSTALTFSVQAAARADLPHAQTLLPGAMRLRAGELSEPLSIAEGALLVFVADRQPGDTLTAEMLRPQLRAAMERRRSASLFGDWMAWNLKRIGHQSNRAPLPAGDGEDEEDWE